MVVSKAPVVPAGSVILPPSSGFPYPSLALDAIRLVACVARCRAAAVGYGLGAKAAAGDSEPGARGFLRIDCSGFVGWTLCQATAGRFPDLLGRGSVEQHDWIAAHGFKTSSVPAGPLHDGAVRIAFLSPAAGGGIGHVMLLLDGQTIESHGGVGPDRRAWDVAQHPFMAHCALYVLTPPAA
jgi:hypothetical protein